MFYKELKLIQIEHSSLCNARCPQCLREWWAGNYSQFNQTYIPTDFYKNRIPQYIYDSLEVLDFFGNLGDPCTAPNFIDVIRIVKEKNPNIWISVSTNGGMKNEDFWYELGKEFIDRGSVVFAIDGLEDTNYIYRINVNWNKLMKNISSFIKAGGNASWQFIMFKHNEHQIEEAKNLSKEMGFKKFYTVNPNRFEVDDILGRKSIGGNGKVLKPPSSMNFKNKFNSLLEWSKVAEKDCITCQAKLKKEAFIDSEMHLFPCCSLSGFRYKIHNYPDNYKKLWNDYGKDLINLNLYNWDEIISNKFYIELENSWKKTFKEGRLGPCSFVCSTDMSRLTEYR